jgi:hypothetical protein
VDLRDAQRRPREPVAKICDVLTDEVARRRDQADVAFFFENRVDGHAQHDFGFARAGRRFEQKLEGIVVESGTDRIDRPFLVVRKRKGFTGLNEFVRDGDRLSVAIDGRPDLGF